MRKMISVLSFISLIFAASLGQFPSRASASAKEPPLTIVYLPLDNRPVNYDYPSALASISGEIEILSPPADILNGGRDSTDTAPLWDWVFANAKEADAFVLSLDSLFYGGLVPSRKHNIPPKQLDERLDKLKALAAKTGAPIYAFSLLMRSLEPKGELSSFDLKAGARRRINLQMIEKTTLLVALGSIDYLIIGRDDTLSYSKVDKDMNRLTEAVSKVNITARRVEVFHGADELGSLLLLRAVNAANGYTPSVYATSLSPLEARTIPLYEDRPFTASLSQRVSAIGGRLVKNPNSADLILLINAPKGGPREASAQSDPLVPCAYHQSLADKIASYHAHDRPVALADIAYANGGDDALMKLLAKEKLLSGLAAYSGWNTASNSIGTALTQGTLYSFNSKAHTESLVIRMVEDWGYQGRLRRRLLQRYSLPPAGIPLAPYIIEAVMADLNLSLPIFFATDLSNNFPNVRLSKIALPWGRLFDISFRVEINP